MVGELRLSLMEYLTSTTSTTTTDHLRLREVVAGGVRAGSADGVVVNEDAVRGELRHGGGHTVGLAACLAVRTVERFPNLQTVMIAHLACPCWRCGRHSPVWRQSCGQWRAQAFLGGDKNGRSCRHNCRRCRGEGRQ